MLKQQPRWILSPPDKNLPLPYLKAIPIKIVQQNKVEYEAETPNGKLNITANINDTYQISKGELYQDMCDMNILNQPEVLRNLVARYGKDDIFTYIGPTLIVVNPYRLIEKHINPSVLAEIRNSVLTGSPKGDPHIYRIAGRAYQSLVSGEGKQAIIISGQSGAGKTESTKYCMQMITNLSHRQSHSIQTKILACNPLLEAFGNSKTVRNDNSSRFGKYVQIIFGSDNTIRGANIISYLLEKSRVVSLAANQRTFHIFYCLTAVRHVGAKQPAKYAYLSQSGCYTAANIKDADYFKEVVQSMNEIGFSKDEQNKIWILLLAILDLGNLEFDDINHKINENAPCIIVKDQQFPKIAKSLSISSEGLEKVLLFQKKIILKQTSFKAYSKQGCISNRNTLTKAIYNSIFEFIIYKIQIALNTTTKETSNSINLLDIFGFENFKDNSLQQLCINFTNEKLLKQYNQYVFENEMVILKEDGLEKEISDIRPPTNEDVISLLSSKLSLFSIINDNTPNIQFQDKDMINGFDKDFKSNKLIKFDRINKGRFTIIHSQCEVSYNIQGFKLKNQDKVNSQIEQIYTKLFVNQNRNQVGKTLLLKFIKEIDDLVTELATAKNHFVRCIKPNQDKLPRKVQQNYMLAQIRYLGVFQTIQIRRKIFPVRKNHGDFVNVFQQIFSSTKDKSGNEAIKCILNKVQAKQQDYLLGKKRIYMNKQLDDRLNKELQKLLNRKRIWKKFAEKQRIILLKYSLEQIVRFNEQKKREEEERKKREEEQRRKREEEQKRNKELMMEKNRLAAEAEERMRLQKEKMQKIQEQITKVEAESVILSKHQRAKQNESLDSLFRKQSEKITGGSDLNETIVVEDGQKPYQRLARPQQKQSGEKQHKFNQSYLQEPSVYISNGPDVIFEKTIPIEMYDPKGNNIDKLQKILSEQYKLEINCTQEEFFSPNSLDCNFQIQDTPSELLNQITCFAANDFFKKVLRKRTTFLGMQKDFKEVLVAKDRPLSKTLTRMDEADEQKALKVFKVMVRIGEEAKLDNVFRLIENMITLCQSTSQQLKNQVFLQLLKQGNTTHELGAIRIYQSLAVYLHIYIPDQDFIMAGLYLLYSRLKEQKSSDKQQEYVRYLFKKMMRKIDNPPVIGYMPIKYQMMALMCKRQISIPVYLPVGNSILIRIQSYDTFADIKTKAILQFGINSRRLYPQMFRFFQIVNFQNQQLQESPINENQIVWDIMTYWQLAKQKYKEANSPPPAFFLMLKVVYAFQLHPDDVEGVELCFAQCYFDYFIGRIHLDFDHMGGLAACVKQIKLPTRPDTDILGSYPIWMVKRYEKEKLTQAMIENIKQMKKQKLNVYQMKFRFLQICNETPLAMSMAIPTDQTTKLFLKPKKIYLTQKGQVKQEFSMKNISKWAIDKEKFVFDVKNGNNHVILTEYAHVCSHYLSELPKVLKKYA